MREMDKLNKNNKSEITLEVLAREVYGRELIYPVNETAKLFAQLVGKKTLTRQDLQLIILIGLKVSFVPLVASLDD